MKPVSRGLSSADAARRLLELGPNALAPPKRSAWWLRFFKQFKSALIYLLLFALDVRGGIRRCHRAGGYAGGRHPGT
jgi:magnesium-transporting ATPase (P-type)